MLMKDLCDGIHFRFGPAPSFINGLFSTTPYVLVLDLPFSSLFSKFRNCMFWGMTFCVMSLVFHLVCRQAVRGPPLMFFGGSPAMTEMSTVLLSSRGS